MRFNDLLQAQEIDPAAVLVLRHRPHEPTLRKVLPWFAAEKPEVFNAYQQTQGPKLEKVMQSMAGSGYVASFLGQTSGFALFIGLYAIRGSRELTFDQYWKIPAYLELNTHGLQGWRERRDGTQWWFDLALTPFYEQWRGKLIVTWPPPERSWWRRAHRNTIPISAVLEESALRPQMPDWRDIVLTWNELQVLPSSWRTALAHWRGIYYIVDATDGKGYVGSAYGDDNLLGRWTNYADRGHGGNVQLRSREPENFRFSILERLSPDMESADVIRREASWKQRIGTRVPNGLNEN